MLTPLGMAAVMACVCVCECPLALSFVISVCVSGWAWPRSGSVKVDTVQHHLQADLNRSTF